MHSTKLRKVSDSVMLAIPSTLLDQLLWHVGTAVGFTVNQGCLVISPIPHPRYTLAELLAISDYSQHQPAEERKWIDVSAVGGELS